MPTTCTRCRRELTQEAFAATSKVCRDCVRAYYLSNQGLNPIRNTRKCPLCCTTVANWRSHYRKYHPDEPAHLPHIEVNVTGGDQLVQSILLVQSISDSHWTWDREVQRVYFLQAGGPERPIKIGISSNLPKRLGELQDANPEPLTVLFTYEGDFSEEARLHNMFRDYWLGGEWFQANRALLLYILDLATTLPGAPEGERGNKRRKTPERSESKAKLDLSTQSLIARGRGIRTGKEWRKQFVNGLLPNGCVRHPELSHEWLGWKEFLGTKKPG